MPLLFGTSVTLERSISETVLHVTGRELAQRTLTWKTAGIVVTQVVLCIFFDVWKSLDPTLLLKEYLSFIHSFIHFFLLEIFMVSVLMSGTILGAGIPWWTHGPHLCILST